MTLRIHTIDFTYIPEYAHYEIRQQGLPGLSADTFTGQIGVTKQSTNTRITGQQPICHSDALL